MTIMTIRIPDDVAAAFDKAFEGQDKDAVIAEIIRQALETGTHTAQAAHRPIKAKDDEQPTMSLVDRFREFREQSRVPPGESTFDEIREIREQLRREAGH